MINKGSAIPTLNEVMRLNATFMKTWHSPAGLVSNLGSSIERAIEGEGVQVLSVEFQGYEVSEALLVTIIIKCVGGNTEDLYLNDQNNDVRYYSRACGGYLIFDNVYYDESFQVGLTVHSAKV